jgi:hypothetical protein
MNPELYEQKRNELVALIDKTLVIEDLPASAHTPLQAIRSKVLENQFEITLVAEFQGGKTTTLNALCDGREIGPRGFGIKTSGCLLSAQNLSDPSASERAEITWRTKQQLVLGFAKLLKRALATKFPDRFQETQSDYDISHSLDLDNDADLSLVRQLLDEEWHLFAKDKAGYSSDKLALLQVASLTVHFYDTSDYRQLRSQTTWNVEDARKLMAFPTDFVQRWTKGDPSAFVLDEVAFVFIARVRCYIHSKNLARIGCVVTDCPGLFASAWDTAVAQDAMFNADGLWYLINGGKAIGQTACDMIRFVCERGWGDRLFYSVNLWGKTKDTILNRILPADLAILNEIGISITKEELRSYHAALALRSVQARACLPGGAGLDDQTKAVILRDAADAGCDSSSVENALLSMIQDHLHVLKVPARREMVDLDEKSVALAQEEGQLGEIMGAIEQRAIAEKAFSILIHNGADKVISALTECEGRLEDIEMAATKKRDAFEAEVHEAQVKLDGFTKESEEAIASLKSVSVAPLADDLFDAVVKDSVEDVAEQSAYRIYHEVLKAWPVIQTLWSKEEEEKSNADCGAVISEEFRKAVAPRLIRWMDGIKHGKNFSYNRTITDNVKRTNASMHRRWHELDAQELLRKIHLPDVTGDPLLDNQLLIDAAKPDEPEDWTLADIIDLSYAGPALVAMVGIIAVLTLHPVGWIAMAAGVVWAAIMSLVGKPLSSKVIDRIKPKLADGIKARLFDEKQKIFEGKKGITAQASRFRDKYVDVFTNEIQKARKKFEETVQAARITFEKSEADRLRIAQEAKECRESHIVPIRQEVKWFRDEVLPLVKTSPENPTVR